MKIKAVYFDGVYPVPGERTLKGYVNASDAIKIEETAHGLCFYGERQSYFLPWANLNYIVLEQPEANVTPIENARKSKGA